MNIQELLDKKAKSRYWLTREIDCTYPQLNKLMSGQAVGIRFDKMEKLCKALDCTISDLFTIVETENP